MRFPVSEGFKIVLGVLILAFLAAGAALLSEARNTGSTTEMVSDSVKVIQNVEYGRVGDSLLALDVYEPRSWSIFPRPAILMIHGGAWIEGDKANERELASILVPKGFVAFAINYRLVYGDRYRYPTQALDVRRAVRWVRQHANEFGADPDRLGAVGWSAGGHLATLLGTTDQADPADPNSAEFSSRVDCVVDTAGPTDFTDESSPPVGPEIARVIPMLFGKPRSEIPDLYREASPVSHVDSRSAPTLIIHGKNDQVVPVDQSRRLERALKAAGVEVKLVEIAGEGHGFVQAANHQHWVEAIADFLVFHLKP